MASHHKKRLTPGAYTVALICPLEVEMSAARYLLDDEHARPQSAPSDTNQYIFGQLSGHNVVIASLPAGSQGTAPAATVATNLARTFPTIGLRLLVGIGGGVPSHKNQIHLGDVVVSVPVGTSGGVIEYDLGKQTPTGFVRKGFLCPPPTEWMSVVPIVQSDHRIQPNKITTFLAEMLQKYPRLTMYRRPPPEKDILFRSNYDHDPDYPTCTHCNTENMVIRDPRLCVDEPVIFYGLIASGNRVMKHAAERDKISKDLDGAICFEMEAAGLLNDFRCIVIRGISDYSDSHKNDDWHHYAAAAAAGFAKEILSYMDSIYDSSRTEQKLQDVVENVNPDDFWQNLPTADQEKYKDTIKPLDCGNPEFYWIFKNMDFQQWRQNGPPILWLSGPPVRSTLEASSYIIDLAKKEASETEHYVLFFFCSSITTAPKAQELIAVTFISTLLYQFIHCSPPNERKSLIKTFLQHILVALDEENSRKVGSVQEFVLVGQSDKVWFALEALLSDERERKLTIVVDGLDNIRRHQTELVKRICTFFKNLEGKLSTFKALLTSRPRPEIKEVLDGLPCIEYDRERKECLAALHFDNVRYDKISKEHEGSFEWIWTHSQYERWSASNTSQLLYIQGKPGSGKSTLTKYFENQRQKVEKSAIVAKFFYSYRDGEPQKSHYNMLRSEYRRQTPSRDRARGDLIEWRYKSLKKVLLSLLDHSLAQRLYLIIDAVDESEEEDRRDILNLLLKLCSPNQNGCIVKVFVASRPVGSLAPLIGKHNFIRLQDETTSDISRFSGCLLKRLELTDILERVTAYIVEHAQGVFVWLQLVNEELLAYVEEGRAEKDIFEFLTDLPKELEEFYKHMLDKMGKDEADRRDGLKMFRFVLFACRPLTVGALLHALGVPENLDTELMDPVEYFRSVPSERRIIHCGGNFLETRRHLGNITVQVMHQTVREYFLRPNGYVAQSKFRMSGKEAHICISITCTRYLLLCARSTMQRLSHIKSWASEQFESCAEYLNGWPLAHYSLCYLKHHVEHCHGDADKLRIISQLIDGLKVNSAVYLLEDWVASNWRATLLNNEERSAAKGFRDKVLHAAAVKGFSQAVEMLLVLGANASSRDKDGRTPLSWAAEKGHQATVNHLLELPKGVVEPDSQDMRGQTPLSQASEAGQEVVVKLLLEAGAEPNFKDMGGQTPLSWAAEKGHTPVVKLLLENGADLESRDKIFGQTPLSWAAAKGHTAVVKLLLERGADPYSKDRMYGQTPLMHAKEKGHKAIVRLYSFGTMAISTTLHP